MTVVGFHYDSSLYSNTYHRLHLTAIFQVNLVFPVPLFSSSTCSRKNLQEWIALCYKLCHSCHPNNCQSTARSRYPNQVKHPLSLSSLDLSPAFWRKSVAPFVPAGSLMPEPSSCAVAEDTWFMSSFVLHAWHVGRDSWSGWSACLVISFLVFTAWWCRCTAWCVLWPGVCPSHAGVVSKQLNGSGWFLAQRLPSAYPTFCCKGILIPPELRVLALEPCPKLWT